MDCYIYYISNVWYSDNMHEQVFTMRVSPCGWLNLFCPIIFKIVTNSTEHTLSWDSDMAYKQLVNRSLTPFYDTRKLITVVKVAHQWGLAEGQKSCTYFHVLSKRLMFFPIWDDCIFRLRCLSCLIGFNYTCIIREDRRDWDDEEDVSSCWMTSRTQEERGSARLHSWRTRYGLVIRHDYMMMMMMMMMMIFKRRTNFEPYEVVPPSKMFTVVDLSNSVTEFITRSTDVSRDFIFVPAISCGQWWADAKLQK